MARIRTARVLAAAASVPLAFALLSGVAQADNGGNANFSGQTATGLGNTNKVNNANVSDSAFTFVDQEDRSTTVNFTALW